MKKIRTKFEDLYTKYSDWANEHHVLYVLVSIAWNAILFIACLGIGLVMYDHYDWYKKYADSYPNLVRWIKHHNK